MQIRDVAAAFKIRFKIGASYLTGWRELVDCSF
jgi:hypothetical protein